MKSKLFIIPIVLIIFMLPSCVTLKTFCIWRNEIDDLDSSGYIDRVEINLTKNAMYNTDVLWLEKFAYTSEGREVYRLALRHIGTYCNDILKIELDGKLYTYEGRLTDNSTISYLPSGSQNPIYTQKESHKYILYIYVNEDDIRTFANAENIRLSYYGQTINMPEWGYRFLDGFVNGVIDDNPTTRKVTDFWIE